jgi:proline iminopeptidase
MNQETTGAEDGFVPFDAQMLDVGNGHALYVEQFGTPDGAPAVYLHGGPGSGCQPSHRALFDPRRFRAVLFDQRGAGRSRPRLGLSANTTDHLVADMERIRSALGIERWLVVGGSWGATLALAYAERHLDRVTGLVLRAVFLGTRAELEWAFLDGPKRFRPDLHAHFIEPLSRAERADPLTAYWDRLANPDPAVHGPAAWRWHDTERVLSELHPASPVPNASAETRLEGRPSTPFMEAHYFRNGCFLEPNELLDRAGRLAGIPGVLIQGRYDLLCPPAAAHTLAEAWPDGRLRIVEGAGHAITEPGVSAAIMAAIDELAGTANRHAAMLDSG